MSKMLFVTHAKEDESNGVWKKIRAQVQAFKNMGFNVDLVFENKNGDLGILGESYRVVKLAHRYCMFYYLAKHIGRYDYIYFRKPHGGLYALFFHLPIKKAKEINENVKIYLEVPTYPYKKEATNIKSKISNMIFDLFFMLARKKINSVLYIGQFTESISGVKAIKINNGVNVENICLTGLDARNKMDVNFAGVANLMLWHGYDRMIESLYAYQGTRNIFFYIVGDTEPEYSRLKKLVVDKGLEEKVFFVGRLDTDELTKFLKKVSICVDALGRHRSGNNYNSSIKSKEYTAMGIPFLKSHLDDSFDNEFFVYQVSANDEIIELDNVLSWYDKLPDNYKYLEREYAINHFSWETIYHSIIDGK